MGKGFSGAVLRALGSKEHELTVTGKSWRAEHFLRVHLHSDTLLDPAGEAPGNWIRAWFPDPDGSSKQFQRGYTLTAVQPETGDFALDFVIHHPMGPAATWAQNCEVGDAIAAMRYGEHPFALLDPAPRGYLFLGDLAGFPAIEQLAAAVPEEHEVVVLIESDSPHDAEIALPQGPNITAAWVDSLPDGQALVQAISGREWTDWYAWITAESVATRHAKTLLQREFGLSKATMHPQAYWIRGRAMGKSETLDGLAAAAEADQAEAADGVAPPRTDEGPAGVPASPAAPPSAADDGGDAHSHDPARPASSGEASATERGILAPAKPVFWAAGIAQALLSLAGLVPFVLFAEVARLFLDGAERAEFERTALWAVGILAVTTLGTALLLLLLHLYDAAFSAALRRRLMDKLGTLPLGWFGGRSSGEVRKTVSDDVSSLHYLVVHAVVDTVGAAVTPIAVLIYLFSVQWRLGLVLLIPLVIYVVVLAGIAKRDAAKVAASQRMVAHSSSQAHAFITTTEVSRVFGDRAIVDLGTTLREQSEFIAEWQRETGPSKIVAVMINRPTTVLGVLVLAGFAFVVPGWIGATDLIPFLILGTSFGGQLLAVSTAGYGLYTGLQARDGIALLLDTPGLPAPGAHPVPAGHVRFDRVRFGYGPGRDVLSDFSLALDPGTVTAIVGPSGAGKSTVASLLARLWDPQAGSVSIDGRDLRDMTSDELYGQVTILLQDVQLIHASVRENIALTSPSATDEEIVAAAKAAHIHERIMALPGGYDTVVASDRLSGGERQRIGIARALLADTPIVVLDEATAAADPDSEWAIQQGLDRLLRGKTVLMIAHRLHTISGADHIVVMADGAVRESGTHAELLSMGGEYASLWNSTRFEETR